MSAVFDPLFVHYSEVIAQMPATFDSHDFIRRLAHEHQPEYIEALYAYRDSLHRGGPAPFRAVHQILSEHLNHCREVVRNGDGPSDDIFGQSNVCAKWRKA